MARGTLADLLALGKVAMERQALEDQLGPMRPVASHPPEDQFQDWYRQKAQQYDLNPNPDDPSQLYDYRSAMMAGASPDATRHWPSQFKRPGHPNEIVGGFNTRTGERVPGAPLARSVEELINLGWEPATAQQLWKNR